MLVCTHKLLPPTLIFPLLLISLLCAVFHLHDANSPPMSGLRIRTEVVAVVLLYIYTHISVVQMKYRAKQEGQ